MFHVLAETVSLINSNNVTVAPTTVKCYSVAVQLALSCSHLSYANHPVVKFVTQTAIAQEILLFANLIISMTTANAMQPSRMELPYVDTVLEQALAVEHQSQLAQLALL